MKTAGTLKFKHSRSYNDNELYEERKLSAANALYLSSREAMFLLSYYSVC